MDAKLREEASTEEDNEREGKNPSIKPKESGEEIAKEDELIIGLGIPMRGRVKRPK